MTYDPAGEVTVDNLGNHWSYDAEGRPLAMDSSAYTYDGDGNRGMKSGTAARRSAAQAWRMIASR